MGRACCCLRISNRSSLPALHTRNRLTAQPVEPTRAQPAQKGSKRGRFSSKQQPTGADQQQPKHPQHWDSKQQPTGAGQQNPKHQQHWDSRPTKGRQMQQEANRGAAIQNAAPSEPLLQQHEAATDSIQHEALGPSESEPDQRRERPRKQRRREAEPLVAGLTGQRLVTAQIHAAAKANNPVAALEAFDYARREGAPGSCSSLLRAWS